MERIGRLASIIKGYESDTFDAKALGVTRQEAWNMAEHLFDLLVKIVEEGGVLRCDGDVLSALLEDIRDA